MRLQGTHWISHTVYWCHSPMHTRRFQHGPGVTVFVYFHPTWHPTWSVWPGGHRKYCGMSLLSLWKPLCLLSRTLSLFWITCSRGNRIEHPEGKALLTRIWGLQMKVRGWGLQPTMWMGLLGTGLILQVQLRLRWLHSLLTAWFHYAFLTVFLRYSWCIVNYIIKVYSLINFDICILTRSWNA